MNESSGSIARNTAAMMGSQVITWISSVALLVILPRFLGDESFGRFYFAAALAGLVSIFVELGIGNYYVIEVSRTKAKASELFVNGAFLRILVWIVAMIAIFIYVRLENFPLETQHVVLILCFAQLLQTVTEYCYRVFQAFEQLQYRSLGIIVEKVSLSLVAITLLMLGYGIVAVALMMVISIAASLIVSLTLLPKVLKPKWTVDAKVWPGLLRGGLPFLINFGLSFIYYRIDVMMLEKMTSDQVVGWYGAPYRLFDALMFFPSILQIAVFPVLSRLWGTSKNDLFRTARRVFDITVIVAVPVAVVLITCAEPIVSLVFGLEKYAQSVIILRLLGVAISFIYINFHIGSIIISTNRQRFTPIIAAIAGVINLSLNYFLIPYFQSVYGNGGIGAAGVTIVTEVSVTAMILLILPKDCFNSGNIIVVMKAVAAGLVMALVFEAGLLLIPVWIVCIIVGFAAYVGLLIMVGTIPQRDFFLLIEALPLPLKKFTPAFVREKSRRVL